MMEAQINLKQFVNSYPPPTISLLTSSETGVIILIVLLEMCTVSMGTVTMIYTLVSGFVNIL